MDRVGFLNALGRFLSNMAGSSVEGVPSLWIVEVTWVVDRIASNCSLPTEGALYSSLLYCGTLGVEVAWKAARATQEENEGRIQSNTC